MTIATTGAEDIIALTEQSLGLAFHTHMPAAVEPPIPTDSGDVTVTFAAMRQADPLPIDAAAHQVAALWRTHGYTFTAHLYATNHGPMMIIEAHNDHGDFISCHLGPFATMLSGQSISNLR